MVIRSILIISLALSAPAYAQDFSYVPNMNQVDYNLPQYATEEVQRSSLALPRDSMAVPAISASPVYKASSARTRQNLANFVAKTRVQDPASADQLQQLFASTDVVGEVGKVMHSLGLSKDNAAHAFAMYWISSWLASRSDISTPSAATARAVANQAAAGLARSPEFSQATEAQKQEMAEAYMVQAALIDSAVAQSQANPDQLKSVANAVSKGAAASGLELDKMTLTEDGFVKAKPRKRADASGAAEGENKDLASAGASGEGDNDNSPNYALIAGAAGAGLGVAFLLGKMVGKKG